jgi:hypothetical protein
LRLDRTEFAAKVELAREVQGVGALAY